MKNGGNRQWSKSQKYHYRNFYMFIQLFFSEIVVWLIRSKLEVIVLNGSRGNSIVNLQRRHSTPWLQWLVYKKKKPVLCHLRKLCIQCGTKYHLILKAKMIKISWQKSCYISSKSSFDIRDLENVLPRNFTASRSQSCATFWSKNENTQLMVVKWKNLLT